MVCFPPVLMTFAVLPSIRSSAYWYVDAIDLTRDIYVLK
eukprot:COSAG02_NODE_11082_length_1796_cov_56.310548_2_plen_39_part_00